jgi:hypothetical protein
VAKLSPLVLFYAVDVLEVNTERVGRFCRQKQVTEGVFRVRWVE